MKNHTEFSPPWHGERLVSPRNRGFALRCNVSMMRKNGRINIIIMFLGGAHRKKAHKLHNINWNDM